MTVIDGATHQEIATVAVAGFYPRVLCYNSQDNKVYCATEWRSKVTVIDGLTDSVIRNFAPSYQVKDLCYNPLRNKVYCAGGAYRGSDSVVVVDGATDSVIASVSTGMGSLPRLLCYNSEDDKLYSAKEFWDVTVIDCSADSVIAVVPTGPIPSALCYNAQNNKVYCANRGDAGMIDSTVTVIDGAGDSLLKTIVVGTGPSALVWNPTQNRVYVGNCEGASISVLRDSSVGGTEESFGPQAASSKPAPTIVRGVLFLDPLGTRSELPEHNSVMSRAALLDISGREVIDLRPGANDVRALAPGVYFIRTAQAQAQAPAIRKVVVTK